MFQNSEKTCGEKERSRKLCKTQVYADRILYAFEALQKAPVGFHKISVAVFWQWTWRKNELYPKQPQKWVIGTCDDFCHTHTHHTHVFSLKFISFHFMMPFFRRNTFVTCLFPLNPLQLFVSWGGTISDSHASPTGPSTDSIELLRALPWDVLVKLRSFPSYKLKSPGMACFFFCIFWLGKSGLKVSSAGRVVLFYWVDARCCRILWRSFTIPLMLAKKLLGANA